MKWQQSKQGLHVFMVCPWARPNIGGVESHLDKLMVALIKRGYSVTLVTYQPLTSKSRGESVERRPGYTIYRLPWFGQGWFPKLEHLPFPIVFSWLFPGLCLGAAWIYWRQGRKIDVIHAHGFIAAAVAKVLIRLQQVPLVVSTHAIYNLAERPVLSRLINWLLRSADQIICVGSPSREELERLGIQRGKIKLLKNWVDIDLFKPGDRPALRHDLKWSDFTVLFVGRLIAKKGLALLLTAAEQLPDIRFIFGGDGPAAKQVGQAAERLTNVDFYGRVSDEELPNYYGAADVFVQLALYEEGQAAVFLESIASGTPVILSERGCARDYLNESVATLIEPTSRALVKTLTYLSQNPKILEAKRIRCRFFAVEHYSEKNVEVFSNCYELAMSSVV